MPKKPIDGKELFKQMLHNLETGDMSTDYKLTETALEKRALKTYKALEQKQPIHTTESIPQTNATGC